MKSKRIMSLLLSVIIIMSMIPAVVTAAADEAIVQITSAADFPSEITEGITYELANDIILTSGQQIEILAGTLDGKGHTITLADLPLANSVTGTIQNLGLLGGDTLSLSGYSGSMAVSLSGTVQNCYSLVNLTTAGWDDIGGLVGTLSGGRIYNSYYAGTNSAMFADGLVGYADGGEIANSCYTVGYSAIGMGGSRVTQINVNKKIDMTGIDAVTALNTDIVSTGYIWVQDTANGGFPVLAEDTGETIVDKTTLEAKIAAAEAISEDKYTENSRAALSAALTEAKAVFADDGATQSEVNSALGALESAINTLEKKKPTEPVSQSDYGTIKSITTQAELEAIGSGNADTYYTLNNDISLDGFYFNFDTFNGVFDGNGKTITFNNDFIGLFKTIGSSGVVQNVHFAGSLGTADSGACAQEVQGAIINCYTEITGDSAAGFAKRLNGGIISNCYSVSKADHGAIIEQTETPNGTYYTGSLRNVYWSSDLNQPIDLSKLNVEGEVKALNSSAMKTMDFVNTLNANRGTCGVSWGQNSNGYPYFGENLEYIPEAEDDVVLGENKTAVAFTSERTSQTTVIENQDLRIDINTALNGIAGLFSLPEYEPQPGERIEWSAAQQSPSDIASIGSEYPYLSVEKEGVLVVTATLVKADGSTEVLACTKVSLYSNEIEEIKLYLAEYDDTDNGVEITDGKATVSGSEDMRILVKAQYAGELSYQTVSESDFTFALSDPEGIVKHSEGSSTFSFRKPGTATMAVTNNNDSTLTASVEITSQYVQVQSVVPGISGTVVLHGRDGNSSSGEDFIADYANVAVTPANASYADSYVITSSDTSVAEYVTDMVYGYVPRKAGTVTYTAAIDDNGTTVSGDSIVNYVYKNPLKNVTLENSNIVMSVGETAPAGLIFEGTLTDGHEITETGMDWSFDTEGIISISRGSGKWKRDTADPDDGSYFLSSDYTIRALSSGTVNVTGTPVDTTGDAQPVSFTVTVNAAEQEAPDIYEIISDGIAGSTDYLQEQLAQLHTSEDGVTYGFEWYVTALLRAGKDIDEDILSEYYESVADEVKTWTSDVKPTDAERTALALVIMGKDITDVDGVDLSALIYNSTKLADGSNELAYALIALDAADVTISDTALWNKDSMITELLKFQSADGGFGLYDSDSGDVDITAICLQALAPYQNDETVSESVQKAITYLKNAISEAYNYSDNSNTTAQVLLALASLGIDVTDSDKGFGDEYYNIISALEQYRSADRKGYLYADKVNPMATAQIMQAYDAYRKAHKEGISYWNFAVPGEEYDDTISAGGSDSDNEDAVSADIYVTIASEGTIVTDKNGGYMAQAPVTVTDRNNDGTLTVDEALYAAHETYYQGGADAGYSSYNGAYGLSLAILWGKGTGGTTAVSGYWLNNVSCMGLTDSVKDGDYLTAFNYCDALYWSDAYSYFNENEVSVTAGNSVSLTLSYLVGYDADNGYAPVFSACADADVVFLGSNNSIQNTLTTDVNGKVSISFTDAADSGTYYVMAYTQDGSIVPAVCKINVTGSEGSGGGSGGNSTGNITVYIRVADPQGKTYLSKKAYSVEKGTSAYELLEKTGLDIETAKSAYGVYIEAIEGLAEFDEGTESGWLYRVNGDYPDYSSSLYTLSKGDYVEWLYTRDRGDDVGDNSYKGSSGRGAANRTVKAEEKEEAVASFADVEAGAWYEESVVYAAENNLFNGISETEFAPHSEMTRAMLVTVIYRLENPEDKERLHSFADVAEGEWYADAVSWAAENGVVNGVSETEFAPNDSITREQMAAVIYRYANLKGYDTEKASELSDFTDANEISDYALDAVKWANGAELINGISETSISPKTTATRAQVAAILMRFCENIVK